MWGDGDAVGTGFLRNTDDLHLLAAFGLYEMLSSEKSMWVWDMGSLSNFSVSM